MAQSDLQSIMQENLYFEKRKELLGNIESNLGERLRRKVAVAAYISNTLNPGVAAITSMNLAHISYVDDLIRGASSGEDGTKAVALIIESYGGDATFPLEVIQRARKYCPEFYMIAVNIVKSAATLLGLLSDKILALETASFGPVDPQFVYNTAEGPQSVSARSIKEMMETTIPNYIRDKGPAERAAVLASQNYALYQQALDGMKLVHEVIDSQLGARLDQKSIADIKQKLVNVPLSHSINVSADELKKLNIHIEVIQTGEPLGQLLTQYHRRALRNLMMETQGNAQGIVLFESRKASLQINAQVMPGVQIPIRTQPAEPRRGSSAAPGAGASAQPATPNPSEDQRKLVKAATSSSEQTSH